jgi:hypothetical protein
MGSPITPCSGETGLVFEKIKTKGTNTKEKEIK